MEFACEQVQQSAHCDLHNSFQEVKTIYHRSTHYFRMRCDCLIENGSFELTPKTLASIESLKFKRNVDSSPEYIIAEIKFGRHASKLICKLVYNKTIESPEFKIISHPSKRNSKTKASEVEQSHSQCLPPQVENVQLTTDTNSGQQEELFEPLDQTANWMPEIHEGALFQTLWPMAENHEASVVQNLSSSITEDREEPPAQTAPDPVISNADDQFNRQIGRKRKIQDLVLDVLQTIIKNPEATSKLRCAYKLIVDDIDEFIEDKNKSILANRIMEGYFQVFQHTLSGVISIESPLLNNLVVTFMISENGKYQKAVEEKGVVHYRLQQELFVHLLNRNEGSLYVWMLGENLLKLSKKYSCKLKGGVEKFTPTLLQISEDNKPSSIIILVSTSKKFSSSSPTSFGVKAYKLSIQE